MDKTTGHTQDPTLRWMAKPYLSLLRFQYDEIEPADYFEFYKVFVSACSISLLLDYYMSPV